MISEAFKDKLMSGLRLAVDSFNQGDDPNTAVIKAASAQDFSVEQTKRLCETFNTARTIYQFHNVADKTAEFSLVDSNAVMLGLFGKKDPVEEKTAAEVLPDYTEYELPETAMQYGELVKAAELPAPTEAVPGIDDQVRRAYRIIHTQHGLAKKALDDADEAEIVASTQLIQLSGILKQGFPMDGNRTYLRLLRTFDAPEFKPVMDKLAEFIPAYLSVSDAELTKEGIVVDDRNIAGLKELTKRAKTLMEEAANIRAVGFAIDKEAGEFEKTFLDTLSPAIQEGTPNPFDELIPGPRVKTAQEKIVTYERPVMSLSQFASGTSDAGAKDKEKGKDDPKGKVTKTWKSGPGVEDLAATEAGKEIGRAGGEYIAGGVKDMLTQPKLRENKSMTERMKNLQREVLLQDLITTDPVISEADPSQVASAYLAVVQIAPEVSMNKEIVRAVLRQSIHSVAISPYDATGWAELERTIQQVSGTMPPSKTVRVED